MFSTHAYGILQDSRWVVGTLDVIPVEIALPQDISKRAADYPDDWQVWPQCRASSVPPHHLMRTLPLQLFMTVAGSGSVSSTLRG